MISIEYVDIPEYLRNSKFYEGIDLDDHATIDIPRKCFKTNTSVNDLIDFESLLHTIRFWIIDDPNLKVLTFVLTNDISSYMVEGSKERDLLMSLPFGDDYVQIARLPCNQRVKLAMKRNLSASIVDRLHKLGNNLPSNMCELASKYNRLDLLQFARFNQCEWRNTALVATARGHIDCLDYALSHGCPTNDGLAEVAAERSRLDCLLYFIDRPVFHFEALVAGARHGHLNCLMVGRSRGGPWPTSSRLSAAAAVGGHLDCLIFVHENGTNLHSNIVELACDRGDLVSLHYAVKHGCVVTERACFVAARSGHLLCLQYARSLGGAWDEEVCRVAAEKGHLHCLKYLHAQGCPWDEGTLVEAVWGDHLPCTVYALLHGCPCSEHKAIFGSYVLALLPLLFSFLFPFWLSVREFRILTKQRDENLYLTRSRIFVLVSMASEIIT